MRPASLLITDGATITVSKLPDGKFQASTLAWTDPAVIGRDQVLEIRTRNGRLYLIRRDKIMEAEDTSGFEESHTVTVADAGFRDRRRQTARCRDRLQDAGASVPRGDCVRHVADGLRRGAPFDASHFRE